MPSKSAKQHRFMAAVANNPKFAKKVGVPKSVGEDFMKADKGMGYKKGGSVCMVCGGKVKAMKSGGMVKGRGDGCCTKGKTRGKMC